LRTAGRGLHFGHRRFGRSEWECKCSRGRAVGLAGTASGWLRSLLAIFPVYSILSSAPRDYAHVLGTVERGEVDRVVSASGKGRALNTIDVGAEVSGQVKAGQPVPDRLVE